MNEDDSSDDDYEDSDSNAEDYYQNDYPEDELSDNAHPCEFFYPLLVFTLCKSRCEQYELIFVPPFLFE